MGFAQNAARIWDKDACMVESLHWKFDNNTQTQPRPATDSLTILVSGSWFRKNSRGFWTNQKREFLLDRYQLR